MLHSQEVTPHPPCGHLLPQGEKGKGGAQSTPPPARGRIKVGVLSTKSGLSNPHQTSPGRGRAGPWLGRWWCPIHLIPAPSAPGKLPPIAPPERDHDE